MLRELKALPGVKVLNKEEQKNLKGGRACCNPSIECCQPKNPPGCDTTCVPLGGTCNCSSGCQYCYTDYLFCGCL